MSWSDNALAGYSIKVEQNMIDGEAVFQVVETDHACGIQTVWPKDFARRSDAELAIRDYLGDPAGEDPLGDWHGRNE